MTEGHIVRNCAPTLAGMKTGSMFTCPCQDKNSILSFIRQFNTQYGHKGLRMLPLRFSDTKVLLYVYRPSKLRRDLSNPSSKSVLEKQGYDTTSCPSCVACLIRKLRQSNEFPHEIGFFLGYPPEDVIGFMEHGPCACKCTGCWKVYGDEKTARKTFAKFKKCTNIYCARFTDGTPMSRLAVSS